MQVVGEFLFFCICCKKYLTDTTFKYSPVMLSLSIDYPCLEFTMTCLFHIKSQKRLQTMLIYTRVEFQISKLWTQPKAVSRSEISHTNSTCFNFWIKYQNFTTDISSDLDTEKSRLQTQMRFVKLIIGFAAILQ